MLYLKKLQATGFRNLIHIDFYPSPAINIFYGDNGAGKSSILEAIYYLGMGKSFRSSSTKPLISHQKEAFQIFADTQGASRNFSIGSERRQDGSRTIKLDRQPLSNISDLTKLLPIQFISTFSHRFFSDGPKIRRQFLDWGVFHVNQSFSNHWQMLQRLLKHRNALLKSRAQTKLIQAWSEPLAEAANHVHQMRLHTIAALTPVINELLAKLLPQYSLAIRYTRGWPEDKDLLLLLSENLQRELMIGYTTHGPHRADFQLLIENTPAQDILSQGQQKLAAYAIQISQAILYKNHYGFGPVCLIDDLPSELDESKLILITDILTALQSQLFVTAITPSILQKHLLEKDTTHTTLFHVEHGVLSKNAQLETDEIT